MLLVGFLPGLSPVSFSRRLHFLSRVHSVSLDPSSPTNRSHGSCAFVHG
jgi:hypothetical protein